MKLFIGIPTRGSIHAMTVNALFDLRNKTGFNLFINLNALCVEENRNKIISEFLKTDCTHLLLLDDDNAPPSNILDLIELDKDVIGCPYLISRNFGKMKLELCGFIEENGKYKENENKKGLQEVDAMGAGCVIIKREVLENIKNPFTAERGENGLWSLHEDLAFFKKVKLKGYKIFAHYDYLSSHEIRTYHKAS